LGVLVFHEEIPVSRSLGFALIWIALALLTWTGLRAARRRSRERGEELT